jgi:hypothetical protein
LTGPRWKRPWNACEPENMSARTTRELKVEFLALLGAEEFEQRSGELLRHEPRRAINPLLSFLCATDEMLRWRAVRAIGTVVSHLAETDAESARIIMRRLIWSLNDESGGIGWGAPEAMGEILARSPVLACEYCCILISYVCEGGNRLENDALERGALWGIARLAQERPELVREAGDHVATHLGSEDPAKRGLAAWCLGSAGAGKWEHLLRPLLNDEAAVRIFHDGGIVEYRVSELAARALAAAGK